MNCSLCNSIIHETHLDDQWKDKFGKKYFVCRNCSLIQLDRRQLLSNMAEKKRYMLHENSVSNKGYITYLNKIFDNTVKPFLNTGYKILDFGCGPEKTWADLLEKEGYRVSTYDPYFDNNKQWMSNKFQAVTSIEVFEHLKDPSKELSRITKCLEPGGFLIIRTMLHDNNWDNFNNWWYREDSTHISFFSERTINYICRLWRYDLLQLKDQCEIILKKK